MKEKCSHKVLVHGVCVHVYGVTESVVYISCDGCYDNTIYMPSLPSKTRAILNDTLNCVAGEAVRDVGVSTCVYKVTNSQEKSLNTKYNKNLFF